MDRRSSTGAAHHGFDTVRIAIGDNLLRKPCATELMKLSKGFIVKRSAKGPREMMKALGELSAYISQSVHEGHSIWIAQKEGRAKDEGRQDRSGHPQDVLRGRQEAEDRLRRLHAQPQHRAGEHQLRGWIPPTRPRRAALREVGQQQLRKGEFEGHRGIVAGIVGQKGGYMSPSAPHHRGFSDPDELAALIDKAIWSSYRLFPGNYLAADVPGKASTIEQTRLPDLASPRCHKSTRPSGAPCTPSRWKTPARFE